MGVLVAKSCLKPFISLARILIIMMITTNLLLMAGILVLQLVLLIVIAIRIVHWEDVTIANGQFVIYILVPSFGIIVLALVTYESWWGARVVLPVYEPTFGDRLYDFIK